MSVDWDGYEPYFPTVSGPSHELPRREARQRFERLMMAKADRIEHLRRLLRANGIELGTTDAVIQDLTDWFYTEVFSPEWRL